MQTAVLMYLVGQSLRRGVSDPAAVRHAHQLCTQLQHMGQRQVADVRVLLTVDTETLFINSSQCVQGDKPLALPALNHAISYRIMLFRHMQSASYSV